MSYRLPSDLHVVQAPMAGGPSTPALTVATANAGGLGFIAGGYLSAATLREAMQSVRAATNAPFGVNLFVPGSPAPRVDVDTYARAMQAEADRLGAPLGDSKWDSDRYDEKLELLITEPAHLVTFTFGCPSAEVTQRLHAAGSQVGVTVTSRTEARVASSAGADVLVVQGTEAGGHQATFDGTTPNLTPLADALDEIRDAGLPMIATGGIMTAVQARTAVAAGAIGVQLGTALLCTPEAGTSAVYRRALLDARFDDTVITRAYSGRYARGLRTRFAREHLDAPNAYPEIHYLTRPLRQAAVAAGDADVPNLWAGVEWRSIVATSTAEVIREIGRGTD